MSKYLTLAFSIIFCASCAIQKESDKQINIFCASSLSPVIDQIRSEWEKDHEEKIIVNVGSSGTLARQIENGADCDIYLSANEDWMNYLIQSMKVKNQQKSISSNRLVAIAPLESELDSMSFDKFLGILSTINGSISMADPGHVPLGKYTKQSMDYYRIYDAQSNRYNLAKDARSALRLVELGEVEIGFTYLSDAITSDKVQIIAQLPQNSYDPIIYQAILLDGSNKSSSDFIEFLTSKSNKFFWSKYGFSE